MIIAPLAAVLLSQLPQTSFSKQSRSFFEGLIDIKIENKVLCFKPTKGFPDVSGLMNLVRSAFPEISRVSVRSENGSSSSGRGSGGGSVTIQIGSEESSQGFEFQLTSPGNDESVTLRQGNAGELLVEIRTPKVSLRFEEEKGKCKLRVKAGADSFSLTRGSISEVFSAHPLETKKYFLGLLDLYFDKTPFVALAAAPPGKTIVRLKDGAEIYGELQIAELKLTTAYGVLAIPRSELVQIAFPGGQAPTATGEESNARPSTPAETLVVTRRYSPVGRLEATSFVLKTSYGELQLQAVDIVQMDFGAPKPEAEVSGASTPGARS